MVQTLDAAQEKQRVQEQTLPSSFNTKVAHPKGELSRNPIHGVMPPVEGSNTTKANDHLSNQDDRSGLNDRGQKETGHSPGSQIHDKTLFWNESVRRLWVQPNAETRQTMLLLTSFGFNHPNQTYGLSLYRGIRTRELLEGVINHPLFHPTGWEDLNSGAIRILPQVRYCIFLDREGCGERNYPRYVGSLAGNADTLINRGDEGFDHSLNSQFARQIMDSKLLRQAPRASFFMFQCHKLGPTREMFVARKKTRHKHRFSFVMLTAPLHQAQRQDQGLPPPAIVRHTLTDEERRDIETCEAETKRPVMYFFRGNVRNHPVRETLRYLNDNKTILVEDVQEKGINAWVRNLGNKKQKLGPHKLFEHIATQSIFGGAPRGDRRFSYRFTELLSMGTIPVLYADDWLRPFGPELINWTEVAIIIPEKEALNTIAILNRITLEDRCRMRQNIVKLYDKYLSDDSKIIEGIIDTHEFKETGTTKDWTL